MMVMKVAKRFGEVTIKKLGDNNKFDESKSFSIQDTANRLTIHQIKELFELTINLSEKYDFEEIKKILDVK